MEYNKVAVVTGASRGIGAAIAKRLAKDGAFVIINYNGSFESGKKVEEEIKSEGGNAVTMKCNVADFNQCEAFIKEILETYKRIDILVNNAGITKDNLLMKMSEEEFDQVININLKGAFNTIRFAIRQMMKQRSGKIINISSVVGETGNAGQANYAASKAGIIGLTKATAREVASRGILVNAVAPGFIASDMTEVLSDKVKEATLGQVPLGRLGSGEDVAAAVAFLASEDNKYITGQVINVDGGMVI
ncbi:3-oxoacyl-[acyl-carrier protein] reductase [Aequitasia blattaphilus]|uniref:3-oxoacyl-[acyl-carrier-protein] reductase n=1 Tax=Aequitasia blattaphilus TaxID=2949332 RepID=A0ABT1E7W9_9FIRM|nr:3-oxoacyl-[acyl-carrier-protein] reductase [Aequitasia blattaphilus]MCP1101883.1 3-oxoacyl-[acyl-carrier-protein] reductase [Aequitasia blattaphilus]MCR8614523.1 3-oxoacyl-[acyl-carrier-protein] reductase [Aequitasia blattaphilus]